MHQITISVPSISCGHCKASIESALQQVAGIVTATVDVASRRVTVVFEPKEIGLEQIRAVIVDQGHEIDCE